MTSVTRERDESKNNSRDSLDRKLGKIEELELNELQYSNYHFLVIILGRKNLTEYNRFPVGHSETKRYFYQKKIESKKVLTFLKHRKCTTYVFEFSRQKSNISFPFSNASKNNQKIEFSRPKPKKMHFSKVPFLAPKFNFSN